MKKWLKRIAVWVLGIVLALISVYALAYVWISWSAKREWAEAKKELEARGEKLSLADFIPPEIPDEDNFFKTPLFADVCEKQDQHRKRIDDLIGESVWTGVKNSTDARGLKNLEAYAERFRTVENKDQPAAALLLRECAKRSELWRELQTSVEKPNSRFPAQYEKHFATPIGHVSRLIKIAQLLHLRAAAEMALGQSMEAEASISLVFRLSDAISTEPLLIPQLIRSACITMAVTAIWEGIERDIWTADQLKRFEEQLASQKLGEGYRLALNGERGLFNSFFGEMASHKWTAGRIFFQGVQSSQNLSEAEEVRKLWWSPFIPWDLAYANMAVYSREIQKCIDALSRVDTKEGLNEATHPRVPESWKGFGYARWRYGMAALAFQGLKDSLKKFAQTQARIDMARIACALERYRITSGEYPQDLGKLVPTYIAKLPNDIAAAKPFHYRRNAPDQFTLWSVGFDGVDDNATPVAKKGDIQGDCVWGVFGYPKQK